jgi:hypothetical protein
VNAILMQINSRGVLHCRDLIELAIHTTTIELKVLLEITRRLELRVLFGE